MNSKNFLQSVNQSNYRSCIKINGLPILPPLIMDEDKPLIAEFKARAIKVERRLLRNRERFLQQQHQQQRLAIQDLNTSSDSSGIYSKSIDSSLKENCQRPRTHSLSLTEFYDNTSVCDVNRNLTCSEYSPDANSTVNTSCDKKSPITEMKLLPNCRIINSGDNSLPNQSPHISYYDNGKEIYPSSPIITRHDGDCDEDSDSLLLNSDAMTASGDSVLQMLPESNKENNNNNQNLTNISRINQQNLNLSPCKDLVLKSDVFSAIDYNNITIRGKKRDFNLSKDFHTFNDGSTSIEDTSKINERKNVHNTELDKNNDHNGDGEKTKIIITPPKLVRQNSYTLDSPSPELLAFVQKQRQKESKKAPGSLKRTHTWTVPCNEDKNKNYSTNFKPFKNNKVSANRKSRKGWNVEEAKQQWNKQKKDLHSQVGGDHDDKLRQRIVQSGKSILMSTHHNYKIPHKTNIQARSADCVFSLTSDSQNVDNCSVSEKQIRHTDTKIDLSPISRKTHREINLDYNFCNLGSNCKQSDVLKKDSLSTTLTPEKDTACSNSSVHNVPYSNGSSVSGDCVQSNHSLKNPLNDDSVSICSSVSLNRYAPSLPSTDKIMPNDEQDIVYYNELRMQHYRQIEELLRKQDEELQALIRSRSTSGESHRSVLSPPIISSGSSLQRTPPVKESHSNRWSSELASAQARRKLNFNNPTLKKCLLDYTEKEREAGQIITAYAKGYLTRRLFKTDKVLEIIKSIKDSMLCAGNFDYANRSNWTQADIDLQARLIVQIEAASFAFREVLNLSTAEKMMIICADRRKKINARKLQPEKPILSAVTQRVIMRKKMQPQRDENGLQSQVRQKLRQRRRSFTGFSCISSSHKAQPMTQSLQKSASTGGSNRQPWK